MCKVNTLDDGWSTLGQGDNGVRKKETYNKVNLDLIQELLRLRDDKVSIKAHIFRLSWLCTINAVLRKKKIFLKHFRH